MRDPLPNRGTETENHKDGTGYIFDVVFEGRVLRNNVAGVPVLQRNVVNVPLFRYSQGSCRVINFLPLK
jgi:hypothetical protein